MPYNKTRKHRGAGKTHPSLAAPSVSKMKNYSPEKKKKRKYSEKYRTTALGTLKTKAKLYKTMKKVGKINRNDSPQGLVKSFRLTTRFLEAILRKYDRLFTKANAAEKLSNYSIFLSILSASLLEVVRENREVIEDNRALYNEREAALNPAEYVKHFLRFIRKEDIVEELKDAAAKYLTLELKAPKMMATANVEEKLEEAQEEYLELSHFVEQTNNAVKETVKGYASALKAENKLNSAMNVDDLIAGLTAVKIAENAADTNKNIGALDALLTKLAL